jgi:UDP-3-O-[3-hydroxymyristoyl] glucosamine N-acyltransferase
MKLTVAEVSRLVGGELIGPAKAIVERVASLSQAGPGDITFARRENLKAATASRATAVIVPERVAGMAAAQIVVANPYFAFGMLLALVEKEQRAHPAGIHPSAVLGAGVRLGKDVALGAHAVLGDGCVLGDRTVVYPNSTLGAHCSVGADSLIYSNVAIREHVSVGSRTIIHSGCSIGGDGFGYLQVAGRHVKVPQVGTVEIGDDVEIGCNCTVDRATMDKTVIENGVKIDNHSHIAHNCRIGANSMLIAYARMGGSTVLGRNVLLAEDVGLTNGITLGDCCIVGAGSKVTRSWPADSVILGAPAQRMQDEKRQIVMIKKLSRLYEMVRELKRSVQGGKAED